MTAYMREIVADEMREAGIYGMQALEVLRVGLSEEDVRQFAEVVQARCGFVAAHRRYLEAGETLCLVRNAYGSEYIRRMSRMEPISEGEAAAVFSALRGAEQARLGRIAKRNATETETEPDE